MDTPHGSDTPTLMQVLGAMLYGARTPLSTADLRRVLLRVAANAEDGGAPEKAFAKVKESEIRQTLDLLRDHLDRAGIGIRLGEVAEGFRYQTDLRCGPWVRDLLDLGKPARLSRPALETLAIIAYRQPITRAEIEAVRGVAVDAIVRTLLEGGLIRIVARSDLPGRPLLYGTTQQFLEHFGLKSIHDLPGIEQLARCDEEWARRHPVAGHPVGDTSPTEGGRHAPTDADPRPHDKSRGPVPDAVSAPPEPTQAKESRLSDDDAPSVEKDDDIPEQAGNEEADEGNADKDGEGIEPDRTDRRV